jgi:hypothetical protein
MTETAEQQAQPQQAIERRRDPAMIVSDEGAFSQLLDTRRFEQLWRVAQLFASSQLVPAHFQGKPADCFIGCQMAMRLGVDPLMFLQNCYMVHNRPGLEAKLAIALINSGGQFTDPLDYEIKGEDPFKNDYRVRCFATRKGTGKVVYGPWIDWDTVKKEKWDGRDGSKWKSIPGLMFMYRAATWFGRLHCPERLMGMQTADELADTDGEPRQVQSRVVELPEGKQAFGFTKKAQEPVKGPIIDRSTSNESPVTDDGQQAPQQKAPPSEANSFLQTRESWQTFLALAEEAAGGDGKKFTEAVNRSLAKERAMATPEKTDEAFRRGMLKAIEDKAGFFAYLAS